MLKNLKEKLSKFFFPAADSPRWMFVLPYAVLGVLTIVVLMGGAVAWEYTNSPSFCGTTCHTMPPQYVTYQLSPHANIYCEDCHIGRAFIGDQFVRKSDALHEIYYTVFNLYEFPIVAKRLRPAVETCEKCHLPELFSDDSLRTITHFQNDQDNTAYNIYLLMKTGGGSKREGLGLGIHWHISTQVEYYATDEKQQTIPFVRVHNEDGTTTDYVDVESGFDPATIKDGDLVTVDCTTCHNRVSHDFKSPERAVDDAMSRNLISPKIPDIHSKSLEVLKATYTTQDQALSGIAGLEAYYQQYYADFYNANTALVQEAIATLQDIHKNYYFYEQEVTPDTHPNNLGHIESPGCFRCHDGKHMNADQEAIRLECNVCHSIPVVAGPDDFVTRIELSRGPEPESHLNPNWISLHNQVFDSTCANCHTTENAGSTENTSFCSNSACHGSVYTYAGFDAPKLREILQAQLPTPTPPPAAPGDGPATYDGSIQAVFGKCSVCHGASASGGLNVTTYADLMKGGKDGPVIVAGDSAASKLIEVQSNKHFSNFTPEELEFIKAWIDAGAAEK